MTEREEGAAMRVEQVMTKRVATCQPDDDLLDASAQLLEAGRGCLVVVSNDGAQRVLGLLTERDVVRAVAADPGRGLGADVAAAMSGEPRVCRPDELLLDALDIMADAGVNRLPVVDRGGQLLGLLSLSDVARVASRDAGGMPALSARDVCRALTRCVRP